MSKVVVAEPENQETYHSENFKLNKKKVRRPPIGSYILLIIYSLYILDSFVYYRNNVF